MTAREFVECDSAIPTGEQLSEEDIIEYLAESEPDERVSSDMEAEDMEEVRKVEYSDAMAGLTTCLSYFEQNAASSGDDLLRIANIVNKLMKIRPEPKQSLITSYFTT